MAATLAVAAGVAHAAPTCRDVRLLFPGPKLGSSYGEVKGEVPASAGCGRVPDNGCEFIDRFGVRNVFYPAEHEGPDRRALVEREQVRRRGGPLPLGIRWSEPQSEVLKKLAPYKPQRGRSDRVVVIDGCNRVGFEYAIFFEFDRNHRLWRVGQWYQAV